MSRVAAHGFNLLVTCFLLPIPLPERGQYDFLERVREGFRAREPTAHDKGSITDFAGVSGLLFHDDTILPLLSRRAKRRACLCAFGEITTRTWQPLIT